jgi:hydrogenase nickel incorporation protein HypA/HybF
LHEVGITQSIVEIAERNARDQGAARVLSVSVEIGDLSGVMADAVEFCFEACTAGTFLEGATLVIRRIPGKGRCRDCGAETDLQPYSYDCTACGGFALDVLQGRELRITEMEID